MLAKHALYQLSYGPSLLKAVVGPGRFELPTSPLSGVRSNQLSYGPMRRTVTPLVQGPWGLTIALTP